MDNDDDDHGDETATAGVTIMPAMSERIVGMPRPPWTPSRDLDKSKTLTKRMGYMMQVLDMEQQVNSPNFAKFPQFSAGDVLEVDLVRMTMLTMKIIDVSHTYLIHCRDGCLQLLL